MKEVAVLLTCHNRRNKTIACLGALFDCVLPPNYSLRVVLVDDGSTDGTSEEISKMFPEVEILAGDGTLFWNRGMHRAFAHAMAKGADAYLLLNDDTILAVGAIESLLQTLKGVNGQGGRAIAIGAAVHPSTGLLTYSGLRRTSARHPFRFCRVSPGQAPVECDAMNGNIVLISRDVAQELGNLDPVYEHAMGDIDYGLRARDAGIRLLLAPGVSGYCADNSVEGTYRDSRLSLRRRFRLMLSKSGLPWRSWMHFTRNHGGFAWPLYFVWPFLKMAVGSLGRANAGGATDAL